MVTAGGAAILGGVPAATPLPAAATKGADRPAAAVIGLGNRGRGMAEWQLPPFADVLAVCDVDLRKTGPAAEAVGKRTGRKVEVYQDYRRLLERRDIQVIGNATPPHWHTKINVDACRAGKDIYAEKPLTYSIGEGQVLRRVVAETGRIVQVGTQQRSGIQFEIACDLVRSGRIGRLKQIAVIVPGGGAAHGGVCAAEPVPPELDWDMWSGPAPLRPFCTARLRANNWSDYAGGLVTDWGAHHMDIAHWAMGGEEVAPVSVEARGWCPNLGQAGYPDQFRPFAARLEYPGGVEMWFFSAYPEMKEAVSPADREAIERVYAALPGNIRSYQPPDRDGGVLFVGSGGTIFVGREAATGDGIGELQNMPLAATPNLRWRACLYEHTLDFVDCVRTRRQPRSKVTEQHRSQLPCHLTNIALRLGRKLQWDAQREEFKGDKEANLLLRRGEERAPYGVEG
jgi:predicted dehydrogenase